MVFVALAVLTWSSAHDAWQSSIDRSRGSATFDLVQAATPTRPTGTPGAVAWLDLQIKSYGRRLEESQRVAYEELVSVSEDSVPELLTRVHDAMGITPPAPSEAARLKLLDPEAAVARGFQGQLEAEDGFRFRTQRFLSYQPADGSEQILVMTRRRGLDADLEAEPNSPSNLFLRQATPYLTRVAEVFERQPLDIEVGGHALRLVRTYGVGEDGSFLSVPIPPALGEAAQLATLRREGQEFRKHPRMPSYVSNEFFFRFDFDQPEQQVFYSGLYLDLAGYGLVSTVTRPVVDEETGYLGVAAVDLAFDIDWRELTEGIEAPQMARLVELEAPPSPDGWQPWSTLRRALRSQRPEVEPALWRALSELADHEQRSGYFAGAGSLFHEVVKGEGAVALFQVSHSRWLAVLFPDLPSPLPWAAATLLLILGSSLVAGVELNRRRAEQAQLKAENELQQKENLLNSMRVPLTVVDPNSDAVVYGNEAAVALGLEPGRRVGDLVPPGRAREHYERMQRSGLETRRAYGVPLRLRRAEGDDEVRHAVVRSVAVAAPIETLHADERHRLGLFFPLEPESDLAIFAEDLERRCRDDERRRLAGLLAHGVDTLVRVLSHRLEQERLESGSRGGGTQKEGESAFVRWLSSYVERRLAVTGWLLDHWSDAPPLPQETTAEAEQVRATLEHFQRVFAWVGTEPELRSRLHWNNGVLSQPLESQPLEFTEGAKSSAFELSFAWPEGYLFTSPVRGGVGLFLEEVLVNALRHGKPGSRPKMSVHLDPVRRELCWTVENLVGQTPDRDPQDLEPYGGRRMLEKLAYLFGWTDLVFVREQDRFRVSWRIQVSERAAPGEAD